MRDALRDDRDAPSCEALAGRDSAAPLVLALVGRERKVVLKVRDIPVLVGPALVGREWNVALAGRDLFALAGRDLFALAGRDRIAL